MVKNSKVVHSISNLVSYCLTTLNLGHKKLLALVKVVRDLSIVVQPIFRHKNVHIQAYKKAKVTFASSFFQTNFQVAECLEKSCDVAGYEPRTS